MWQSLGQEGSLTSRIVAQIEALIASDALKPGDQLPSEREMATLLAVSRPSLREAIRTLAAQNRLIVRHGQGVFVEAPPSERELRSAFARTEINPDELYAMREVLEVPAAGWAATRRTEAQIAGLRDALLQLDAAAAVQPPNFDGIGDCDAAFHLRIVEAAGNKFMRQTVTVLHEILRSGMETTLAIPGRIEASRRDHQRILAAIESGNAAQARQAARHHVRSAKKVAMNRINAERSS